MNDYVVRFFLAIFVVEIQPTNAMVDDDDDRPDGGEFTVLFLVRSHWYLPSVADMRLECKNCASCVATGNR